MSWRMLLWIGFVISNVEKSVKTKTWSMGHGSGMVVRERGSKEAWMSKIYKPNISAKNRPIIFPKVFDTSIKDPYSNSPRPPGACNHWDVRCPPWARPHIAGTNLTLLLLTEKWVFKVSSKGRLLGLTNSLCYKLYNSHTSWDNLKCQLLVLKLYSYTVMKVI